MLLMTAVPMLVRGVSTGSPENAGKEHNDQDRNDDQWGSDVHAKISLRLDYQTAMGSRRWRRKAKPFLLRYFGYQEAWGSSRRGVETAGT